MNEPQDERQRRTMYLLLYPREVEEDVLKELDATGVPGYSVLPKLVGRGREPHFDNPVWPGATGAVLAVVQPQQAGRLADRISTLGSELRSHSHDMYRLHLYALPCEELL
jgi:hypothetical protein